MSDTAELWTEVRGLRDEMDELQKRRKVLDKTSDDLQHLSNRLASISAGLLDESKTAEQLSLELANLFTKEKA